MYKQKLTVKRKSVGLLRMFSISALLLIAGISSGCGSSDEPLSSPKNNQDTGNPKTFFWETFYAGDYDKVQSVIEQLTGTYLQNLDDPEVALLLAHSHFWKAGESSRMNNPPPSIFGEFVIAKYYFDRAAELSPNDSRIVAWSNSVDVTLGMMHDRPELIESAYEKLLANIPAYPENNHFSAGFPLAMMPPTSPMFPLGIEHMWDGVDACLETKIDRDNPDYAIYMHLETDQGSKRVCWNNEKTPHGFEGYFLAFGDMLVKNGQPEVAKRMYENAKYSPIYDQWKYQDVLEKRISSAETRSMAYQLPNPADHPPTMLSEPYACMACHGNS